MAIRNVTLPLAPLLSRTGSSPRSIAVPVLALLSVFPGVGSPASAQTSSQQYVYVSVPGPPTTSAVSGLSKVGQTGALGLIPGSPFNERLEGGLMAIDGQGKFLFVLNPKSNDVSMFQIVQASGALSEVPGSPFAVPPTINPNMAPSQPLSIATEASGKFLFVGYYLGDISGQSAVVSLAINTSGASPVLLTVQSTSLTGTGAPLQLLTDAKGLHVYVGLSTGQNGIAVGGAEVYSIDSSTGKLAYLGMADSLSEHGQDYAIDPQTRFFFAGGMETTATLKVASSHRWMVPRRLVRHSSPWGLKGEPGYPAIYSRVAANALGGSVQPNSSRFAASRNCHAVRRSKSFGSTLGPIRWEPVLLHASRWRFSTAIPFE